MNRIAIVRRKHGVTQEELAAELGMDQSSVSKIENEKVTVSLDNLRAIAAFLGSSIGELVETPIYSDEAMLIAKMYDALSAHDRRQVRALVRSMNSEQEDEA